MSKLPTSIFDFTPADRRQNGFWVTKHAYYLLWFEYLAISPSYDLARRFRANKLNDQDLAKLPEDFEVVLSVYDNLGDVQRILFPNWWGSVAQSPWGFTS